MTPPRAPQRSPKQKRDVVKDFRTREILEAARHVIGEVGFQDASVERIALQANVAKGTLYLYFDGKESLLSRALRDGHEDLMERTHAAVQFGRTTSDKLRAVVAALLEFAAAHEAFCQVLLERPDQSNTGGAVAETLRENFAEHIRFVASLLEAGRRSGEFRELEPARAAQFLFELIRAALRERFRDGKPPDPDSDVEIILDFYLHGVAAGEPK